MSIMKILSSCLTSLRERGAGDFLVVEVKCLTADDLVILVALPGNQHEVAGLGFGDCLVNRVRPVGDLAIGFARSLNSLFRVAEYLLRIFRARVVRRENYDVAQTARGLTHRRSLRPVAITATPKHRDDLSLHHLARRAQDIQQRIVTVRVINDDRESSVMHHALETSRRAGTFFERGCYDVEAVTERESARDRRECVVDVRWTNQRRMKIAFTRGRRESKAHTTQRKLR